MVIEDKSEITVIVLTCKRPRGLRRIINSIKKNTVFNYDLLVVIDNNDADAYNYCLKNNIKCLLSSFHRDFVAQANMAIYACETEYFVILADDTEIITPNWLSIAIKVFKERFPSDIGLLAFNDGIQKGRIFTMGMSSKSFIEFMGGYLYYPGYKHYCGDREVSRLAKELNSYHYDETIKVEHHHFSRRNVKKDHTYKTSERKFWQVDKTLRKWRDEHVDLIFGRNHYNFKQ